MSELIELVAQEFVLVEETISSTIEILNEGTVSVTDEVLTLVSEATQGPPGIQGPQGPAGSISASYVAATNLSGHRIVTLNSLGQATYASSSVVLDSNRLVGMTTGAAMQGGAVTVQSMGELTEPSWNWNVNLPVYLALDGLLTQIAPTAPASKFSTVVGFPISATTLHLNIGASIALTN